MIGDIDAAARSKARAAIQHLLRNGAGAVLPRRKRPLLGCHARRFVLGLAAFVVLAAAVAVGAGAFLLSAGPISLVGLNPRIAQSLQERLGPRYVVSIGPTSLARADGGLAFSFSGISIRDRSGRAVLSAPGGRVGLDAWSLLQFNIKVKRLDLDGLDLRLRVRPDGALSIAAAADADATTIDLPAPIPPAPTSPPGRISASSPSA